jgi:hypothetical protein
VGRDAGRDKGGDNSAWLDLVARLEMPAPVDPDDAPWPDRENLQGSDPTGQPGTWTPGASPKGTTSPKPPEGPGAPSTSGSPGATARPASPADRADTASKTDADRQDGRDRQDTHDTHDTPSGAANPGSDKGTTSNQSRVIRPATFTRYSELADEATVLGRELPPGPELTSSPAPDPYSQSSSQYSSDDGYLDAPTSPDLGFLDFLDYEDDPANPENRYIPPPPPPMRQLDPVVKGAWLALFGGPGYLLLATILGWEVPGWAELLAIAAFVTGFVVLVLKLGDGPSRRDGPDQGAVV